MTDLNTLVQSSRLEQQLRFLLEIDRLKGVQRMTRLVGIDRRENSAEHSWHLAMLAMLLAEYANEPLDTCRVIKMVLVHDLVEIDAGDAYCYDAQAVQTQAAREDQAAKRIFGLLPDDQTAELQELWEEFEAGQTAEARFAAALDRTMPLLHNYFTDGSSWLENKIVRKQVLGRVAPVQAGSQTLAQLAERLINSAVEKGILGA